MSQVNLYCLYKSLAISDQYPNGKNQRSKCRDFMNDAVFVCIILIYDFGLVQWMLPGQVITSCPAYGLKILAGQALDNESYPQEYLPANTRWPPSLPPGPRSITNLRI